MKLKIKFEFSQDDQWGIFVIFNALLMRLYTVYGFVYGFCIYQTALVHFRDESSALT